MTGGPAGGVNGTAVSFTIHHKHSITLHDYLLKNQ